MTSLVKGYPFEVALPAGLPIEGVVLSDQIKSLDWRARKAKRIAKASPGVIDEVRHPGTLKVTTDCTDEHGRRPVPPWIRRPG